MDNLFPSVGGNKCFTSAALAEGTGANTIKTTVALTYTIDGVFYSKAITDNIAMTALPIQAVATTAYYGIWINTAGTVTMTKLSEWLTTDIAAGNKVLQGTLPVKGLCLFGIMKVVTNGSTTYTNGSVDLSAAGVTATFQNYSAPPAAPLTW